MVEKIVAVTCPASPLWTNVGNHDQSSFFFQSTPKQGLFSNFTPFWAKTMKKINLRNTPFLRFQWQHFQTPHINDTFLSFFIWFRHTCSRTGSQSQNITDSGSKMRKYPIFGHFAETETNIPLFTWFWGPRWHLKCYPFSAFLRTIMVTNICSEWRGRGYM